jgi:formate dehydrogenase alpha subunit
VSWDEAVDIIASRLSEIKDKYGPDSIGFMGSACFTNEELYIYQKFVRAVIGTNNIDSCARICHIPSLKALMKSIGSATMTNTIDEISDTKVIFIAGYNPEACHPRLYHRYITAAKKRGSKIIVMDPRITTVAKIADVFLQVKPGTEIPILNSMANIIIKENLIDELFIQRRTEGFDELKRRVEKYSPEYAAKISDVPAESIIAAARLYATKGNSVILWGMGMTQHICGVDNVSALINLCLLTGNIGKPNTGLSPVRGQNNVQGASFIGALPDVFPGYKQVTDPAAQEWFKSLWGVASLPKEPGRTSTVFLPDILEGKTKALYIAGENPAVSQANLNLIRRALANAEFLVVQEVFMTETAEFADVILPACTFAEKGGTYIRLDRAIQLLNPAISPLGESLPDWKIIQMIASKMGYGNLFPYHSEFDIHEELRKAVPDLTGITYERLQDGNAIHMPCPDTAHPGVRVRYTDVFPRPGGKALFVPVDFTPPAESPDEEYPFTLITGRDPKHFNTSTIACSQRRIGKGAYLEIHPEDAKALGLSNGDEVEARSRRGKIILEAKITERVRVGIMFAPLRHCCEFPINLLTSNVLDPVAKTPEYKVSAIKLKKVEQKLLL